MKVKTAEKVTYLVGGISSFLGFAGLGGWTETGNGLFISLAVLVFGVFNCMISHVFGNLRRRNEHSRIY